MLAHRTTFSLDQDTIDGIRTLASTWETSQAGAVRKAIAQALAEVKKPLGVAEAIALYRAGAVPRTSKEINAMVQELRQGREDDAQSREKRLPPGWRSAP